MEELLYEQESYKIRGAVFAIYKEYRNYHKEKIYHNSLYYDLLKLGFKVEKEKRINVVRDGRLIGSYVPDLIVDNKIIIELKCKPMILISDRKQFWTYLKGSSYHLGFLINFGAEDGVEIERKIFTKNSA
ncbi:MAG TPA: GxxExxY protein [Patescibacteria group bacterium]|nr:GxxExxY protein [Patescibacteria group bacterium]